MSAHDLTLTIDGRAYGGWTEVEVRRGMAQLSGSFSLSLTDNWPGGRTLPIRAGSACTVAAHGQTLITGYVDEVERRMDANSHTLAVRGRDAAADLVDCSARVSGGQIEGRTLEQIARVLVGPFGITVTNDNDFVGPPEPFKRFTIQQSETVWEALERGARMRGVLIMSDGQGGIVITRASTRRVPVGLALPGNILKMSTTENGRERFSSYTVLAQTAGDDNTFGTQAAAPQGTATDPGVTRYRPLVVLAEDGAAPAALTDRAVWESNVRIGRSLPVQVTVQGWRPGDRGGVWMPNRVVPVTALDMGIVRDLLVESVTLTRSERGTRTVLDLVPPVAYARIPIAEADDVGGFGAL